MKELLGRYSDKEQTVIYEFFEKLARVTNKTGKMRDSKKEKIIAAWEPYKTNVVIESLSVYIKMDVPQGKNGRGTKGESYVLGIMKNKASEALAKRENYGEAAQCVQGAGADEGERLRQLIAKSRTTGKEPECDF